LLSEAATLHDLVVTPFVSLMIWKTFVDFDLAEIVYEFPATLPTQTPPTVGFDVPLGGALQSCSGRPVLLSSAVV
jgi:hypothetical protein